MPTTEEEQTNKSIPLAMQALFYKVSGGLKLWLCGSLHSAGADLSVCQMTAVASSLESSLHHAQKLRLALAAMIHGIANCNLSVVLYFCCWWLCVSPSGSTGALASPPLRLTLAVLTAAAIWE